MLAEKFLLLLETLRSNSHDDGAPRVISTSPHIATDLADTSSDQTRRLSARNDSAVTGR